MAYRSLYPRPSYRRPNDDIHDDVDISSPEMTMRMCSQSERKWPLFPREKIPIMVFMLNLSHTFLRHLVLWAIVYPMTMAFDIPSQYFEVVYCDRCFPIMQYVQRTWIVWLDRFLVPLGYYWMVLGRMVKLAFIFAFLFCFIPKHAVYVWE